MSQDLRETLDLGPCSVTVVLRFQVPGREPIELDIGQETFPTIAQALVVDVLDLIRPNLDTSPGSADRIASVVRSLRTS